jgi:isopropylmalate/homocitrate/citramalate synthase
MYNKKRSKTKKFQTILKKMDLKLSREEAKKLFFECKAILKLAKHTSHFELMNLIEKSKEKGLDDALQLIMFAKELGVNDKE